MNQAMTFRLTAGHDKSVVLSGIKKLFRLSPYKHGKHKSSMYDSFDWRLYRSDRLLLSGNHTLIALKSISSEDVLNEEPVHSGPSPRFWWDFHGPDLKSTLKSILDMRALIKMSSFEEGFEIYSALNEDAKTVARIGFYKISGTKGSSNPQAEYIQLMPLKGYDNELKVIRDTVMRLKITPVNEHRLVDLLRDSGLEPGRYTSKIDVPLDPTEQGSSAMKKILRQMLNVIRQNEDGIKKDIDTEFLHDFRVAIRRTRSAISQVPGIFPQEDTARFGDDFKYLGQLSNRLRDLDVYILNKDHFSELLPQELRPGLTPLFKSLQKERQHEFMKFVADLDGARCRKILAGWEQLLGMRCDADDSMANAERPILSVATEFITKRYKKTIKSGKQINDTASEMSMHGLRIQCKKLRYLLEFFSSLFPRSDIDLFIRHLKKMQDILGEFNDLTVQQEELRGHLKRIGQKGKVKLKEAAALGGLISVLKIRQDDIRFQFKAVFEEFHNRENTELFHKLFD
jgi:CHAD domain-containing protein